MMNYVVKNHQQSLRNQTVSIQKTFNLKKKGLQTPFNNHSGCSTIMSKVLIRNNYAFKFVPRHQLCLKDCSKEAGVILILKMTAK